MADPEREDLDREDPLADEDVRGREDEDFESDEEDLEDEEELDADERLTGEVGSEGGSPGETVATRRRREHIRGSEAGETWSPDETRSRNIERVGEQGQPRKRTP
jgi:hypothetical protein